jgi:hypothetical protein
LAGANGRLLPRAALSREALDMFSSDECWRVFETLDCLGRRAHHMTPAREKREQQKFRRAIWRWYRLGGHMGRIIEIAEWMYATKAVSLSTKKTDE